MATRGEVLVAILNSRAAFETVRDRHWYHIPLEQVEKLKHRQCWCPKWLAFYQTKTFGADAHRITYYAEVIRLPDVQRWQLFPDEPAGVNREKRYVKLELGSLESLSHPIVSRRLRRITFIPTTLTQLKQASDIRDLWSDHSG
ncbi:hypothetical protein H6F43_01825 [Leptolyngbya sp. FACHB-36]|uniref:hypothetical protein n=1 Tax=Leptolyngbya sp. FACHB-36 TaxID=2692808 RepID=UPI001680ECD7|nr:hypothetical protein [Leptolyngbya sp. FACHB-36]MBD2018924.1 hypothetical protein [Leptolyngbya sp. FACHB-36]